MASKNKIQTALPDGTLGQELYRQLASGEIVEREPQLDAVLNLASDFATRLDGAGQERESLASILDERFRRAAIDLDELPLNKGRARPSDEQYELVDSALEAASDELRALAEKLFESFEYSSVAEAYNGVRVYEPGRAEIIMNGVQSSPALKEIVRLVTSLHEEAIASLNPKPDDPRAEAVADVNKVLVFDATFKYFNTLKPARALINRFRTTLFAHCIEVLKKKTEKGLPASKGGKALEGKELEFFGKGMELSQGMFDMDELSKRDLLNNPLGQAMSAAAGKAYNYTKNLEQDRLGAPVATYGFMFLDEAQATALNLLPSKEGFSTEFSYFGRPYYAVPYGRYCLAKKPEEFRAMLATISEMGEVYPDSPAAEYAEALQAYLSYGNKGGNATEYSRVCYEAECAWVRYVRYANANRLPFIFVHPFEQYTVASIKDHDLALCPTAVEGQEIATELQGVFTVNLQAFFDRTGLTASQPEMCRVALDRISKMQMSLVAARLASSMPGILAQTVPNYEPGQKEGLVVLGDHAYAIKNDRAISTNNVRSADPVGGFAEFLEQLDDATYTLYYVQFLLGHELGHHIFKGKDQKGVESDGKGLSMGEIEEAKASHGVLFSVEDPNNLKPDEVERMRKLIPLMLDLDGVGRFAPNRLKNFRNDLYTRTGAVFLDYALKSGILEVTHIKIEEGGENYRVLSGVEKKEADTAFLKLHLEDDKIRNFISRMAQFLEEAAEPYAKISGFEPSEGTTITLADKMDCETWQTIKRLLLNRELAALSEKGPEDPAKTRATKELEKIEGGEDPSLIADVNAIVDWRGFELSSRLKKAVARAKGLPEGDEGVNTAVAALKEKLKREQPQVTGSQETL